MKRKVIFAPEAQRDLFRIDEYVSEHGGSERALAYTRRIFMHCMSFADFPKRGTLRDDLRPGLRVTGFEKRVAIAFHITEDAVIIDRILYGGQDLGMALSDDD